MDESSSSVEPCVDVPDNLLEELACDLHKSVKITNDHELDNTSDGDQFNDCGGSKTTSEQKLQSRYESFLSPVSSDKDYEEPELALQELFLKELPPLKPVSAMKGSREKRGETKRGLRVAWAADVYDPLPTSVSHAVRRGTKQQKVSRKDKRNGKRGHKGKDSSRGSWSKDSSNWAGCRDKKKKKKQSGQVPVSSNTCYKLPDPGNGSLEVKPDQVENYSVAILDASCGSSFLKTSLTKSHYSVTEAL